MKTKKRVVSKVVESRKSKRAVTYRIPKALLRSIDGAAQRMGCDRTQIVVDLLWRAVDQGQLPQVPPAEDPRQNLFDLGAA